VIDRPALVAWRSKAPWPNPVQIEQDLLLSRLMIEIARDEVLGPELAMRGGTCLHKLHLPTPLRYSEDLDYVRATHTGIKPLTQALGEIADRLGLTVSSRQRSGQMGPRLLRRPADRGHRPHPHQDRDEHRRNRIPPSSHECSPRGGDNVVERRGRDPHLRAERAARDQAAGPLPAQQGPRLFDLWLGLTVLRADPDQIVAGFDHYMGDATFSFPELRDNLAAKLRSPGFHRDLDALVTRAPTDYAPDTAADLVMRELGGRLRNAPPIDEIAPLRS
jgi:hypothetical protein